MFRALDVPAGELHIVRNNQQAFSVVVARETPIMGTHVAAHIWTNYNAGLLRSAAMHSSPTCQGLCLMDPNPSVRFTRGAINYSVLCLLRFVSGEARIRILDKRGLTKVEERYSY